jgi:hypothetical protein
LGLLGLVRAHSIPLAPGSEPSSLGPVSRTSSSNYIPNPILPKAPPQADSGRYNHHAHTSSKPAAGQPAVRARASSSLEKCNEKSDFTGDNCGTRRQDCSRGCSTGRYANDCCINITKCMSGDKHDAAPIFSQPVNAVAAKR